MQGDSKIAAAQKAACAEAIRKLHDMLGFAGSEERSQTPSGAQPHDAVDTADVMLVEDDFDGLDFGRYDWGDEAKRKVALVELFR